MPFGNESAWDPAKLLKSVMYVGVSPMPFGNESAWDVCASWSYLPAIEVTNAFRQ